MNKKQIIILIILLAGAITAYRKASNLTTLNTDSKSYTLEQDVEITKIEIEDKFNHSYIKKEKNDWIINDSLKAGKAAVKLLIKTFRNIELKSPVAINKTDEINKKLIKEGKTIRFFSGNNLILELITGKGTKTKEGTYAKKINQDAVILQAPGIAKDFSLLLKSNYIYWADNIIFAYYPSKIRQIEIINNKNPEKSFILEQSKDIKIFDIQKKEMKKIDTVAAKRFLTYFWDVRYSAIAEKISARKAFVNPLYKIKVRSETQEREITIFPKTDSMLALNLDKAYIKINTDTQHVFTAKYFNIDALTKNIDYFKTKK